MRHAAFIDGRFTAGEGASFTVEDPSDQSIVAELTGASVNQISAAIEAARRAFDDGRWSGQSKKDRVAAIRRYGEALSRRADRLTDLAVAEAGCPLSSSVMNAQVAAPLNMTEEIAEYFSVLPDIEDNPIPLHERVTPYGTFVQSLKRHIPIGVVTAISAYNVPFYTAYWKVLPALIAGNSVLLRPNPLTPLSAMIFAEAAAEAGIPDGVLNVVVENGMAGARLMTTDPRIDMVSFTGSCAIGAQVAAQAGSTLKRVVLELGGKSAQIFLPDSVEKAALHAWVVCVAHAGQGCALGTRIFVPQEHKAAVLEAAAERIAGIKIGSAHDRATQTGPLISAAQRDRCDHFTRAAVEHGGHLLVGGKRPPHLDRGYYWEPTLLDLPDNANPAAQEEIFGPVVSVIGYRDLDHAVEMANATKFGLSGYVHGQDRKEAMRVALGLRSGTVNINGALMSTYAASGGIKMSGLGHERGLEGLRDFQHVTTLNIAG